VVSCVSARTGGGWTPTAIGKFTGGTRRRVSRGWGGNRKKGGSLPVGIGARLVPAPRLPWALLLALRGASC
jgi:hypothetical protein